MCVVCNSYTDYYRLVEQGYKVVGVELSEVAVKWFFTEHQLEHKVVTASNGATIYEVITWGENYLSCYYLYTYLACVCMVILANH